MTKTVTQIIYSCSHFCCYIPYTGEKQIPVENVQLSVVEHAGSLPGVQTRSQQVLQLKLISLKLHMKIYGNKATYSKPKMFFQNDL